MRILVFTIFPIITLVFLFFVPSITKKAFGQVYYCAQSQEIISTSTVTLRGQITNTGGDPNIKAWFRFRKQGDSYWQNTPIQNLNVTYTPFNFSYKLTNLQQACTNYGPSYIVYEYKAVAQNSAGESEGNTICFTIRCFEPLQVSCSAIPNPAKVNENVIFTANVLGGQPPYYYNWTGACTGSSNTCATSFNSVGTYTATIYVKDASGNQAQASCSVRVTANLPTVITLPPVETL